jgi:hypothetical protein
VSREVSFFYKKYFCLKSSAPQHSADTNKKVIKASGDYISLLKLDPDMLAFDKEPLLYPKPSWLNLSFSLISLTLVLDSTHRDPVFLLASF